MGRVHASRRMVRMRVNVMVRVSMHGGWLERGLYGG